MRHDWLFSIPEYVGGGVAKHYHSGFTGINYEELKSAINISLSAGEEGFWGDDMRDHYFIKLGIHLYEMDQTGMGGFMSIKRRRIVTAICTVLIAIAVVDRAR